MRLRRFILASLAALVAFVSCEDLENLGLPTIKLDGDGTMAFEIAGGDQQITLTATRDWWIECDAGWLDFLPKEGKASADAQTITITAKANGDMDRTADVKFSIGMSFQTLTVTQTGPGGAVQPGDGTKTNPYSAEKANEVASALGADDKITGVYVQGVVSEIKELSTEFGNATYWITDEGGKTTFYVYRGRYLGNAKFTSSDQLKVGDKVVVYGDLMNYMEDSPQLAQGNYLVSLNGTEGENSGGQEQDKSAIYHNNFDKETASKSNEKWPYLDQFEGWKNEAGTGASGVTYTFKSASARATSGNNNIWLPKTGGYLSVQGIALNGTTALELSFGVICGSPGNYKKSFSVDAFKVYVSADNAKWVELECDVTVNDKEFDSAVAVFSVPANTASLSIAFEKVADETDGYRVDDVKLAASASAGTAVDFAAGVAKDFGNGGSDEGGSDEGNTGGEGGTEVVVAKSIETGDYWIMTADKSEVVIPIDDQGKGYGYWNVEAAADGASTAENAFTFTWVDGKGYTIQDSEGRHHYMTTYNSFSISTSEQSDGSHYWAVTANTDGTYSIVNTVSGKTVQMSSHGNFCPYTDVTGDLPTLVKADGSTGGDVTPPEGGEEPEPEPEPEVSTVAEVLKSTIGDAVSTQGTVMAIHQKGYILGDATGAIYVYTNSAPTVAVGNNVALSGTFDNYFGTLQIKDAVVSANDKSTTAPSYPTPVDLTDQAAYDAFKTYGDSSPVDFPYVKVKGVLSGRYITVGSSEKQSMIYYSASDYSDYDGKTVTVLGYIVGFHSSNGYYQIIETSVVADESSEGGNEGGNEGGEGENPGGEVTPPAEGGDPAPSEGLWTKIESVDGLSAGTYYMGGYLTSYSYNKDGETISYDWSDCPYHLCTGVSSDLKTSNYAFADGQLTKDPDSTDNAVEVILEAVEGKANTYYVKIGGKYLYSSKFDKRSLASGDDPVEWVASSSSKGGINLTTTFSDGDVILGTAGAASDVLRSYKSPASSLKYGLVFFKLAE